MTTLTAGADPRILKPEDLVRYAQPSTPLEEALLSALKEAAAETDRWFEVGYDVNKLTPQELADYIDGLQRRPSNEDLDAFRGFFSSVSEAYLDVFGDILFAEPDSQDFREAIRARFLEVDSLKTKLHNAKEFLS